MAKNISLLKNTPGTQQRKPLQGQSVVVTRQENSEEILTRILQRSGARVFACPVMQIKFINPNPKLRAKLRKIRQYDWLMFTSAHGVASFFEEIYALKMDSRNLSGLKFAVVGDRTGDQLKANGIIPDLVPKQFAAEGLIKAFRNRTLNNKALLFPRALVAREVLPEALRSRGAKVDIVPVYENKALSKLPPDIPWHKVTSVTFASSSAVEHFMALVKKKRIRIPENTLAACIGPATEKTASFFFDNRCVARHSTFEDLGAAVLKYFLKKAD